MIKKIAMQTAVILIASSVSFAEVTVKVRDISFFEGMKENQVFGYGLVVGLQGTGDSKLSPLTKTSLKNLLKNIGMESEDLTLKNSAAVLVTAQLPPYVRVGDRVDVTVSSIGDAKSLEGGMLVQSQLKGADNAVYVAAQGPLTVSKIKGGNRKEIKSSSVVTGGGVVEKEIPSEIVSENSLTLVIKNWDYTVANNILKAIAEKYPESKPELFSSGKIKIGVVKNATLPEFIAGIESIEIAPSTRARVVVNERDGTIVTGGEVKISEAMISREGVTVEIPKTAKKVSASHIKDSPSVKDLVEAMNSIGASTADIISILKALKSAGALHAELIVR